MANGPVPAELARFIARYIRSVEQLEILCLVSSDPPKSWTVAEVFREVQSSEKSVADCLEEFQAERFLSAMEAGIYRFNPSTPALADLVRELSKTYRERRVAIIEIIYQKPPGPIQDFAEAFRLRKDK